MDESLVWILVFIAFLAIINGVRSQKKITETEKKFIKIRSEGVMWAMFGIYGVIIAIVLLYISLGWAIIAGVISIGFLLYSHQIFEELKGKDKEIKETIRKEEQEETYKNELIKEKARLQAQKEFSQHKKR